MKSLENSSSLGDICKRCERKVFDFYNFKKKCLELEEIRSNQTHPVQSESVAGSDKLVISTVQLIQEFLKKNGGIREIRTHNNQLIISAIKIENDEQLKTVEVTSTTNTNTFQNDITCIKKEPSLKEIEIKEEFVEFNEKNETSNNILSKLPAFCSNRFYDGNRFVSRTEYLQSRLKRNQTKRQRNPETWASSVQKKLRIQGQQYRSVKGNIVPARKVGLPCNCRMKCSGKISENNRRINFKRYWDLETAVEKRKYLCEHIKLLKPKRALTKARIFSRIMHHFLDVFNCDGSIEKLRVCKKMFCSTFDISNSVITNSFKLLLKRNECFTLN